MPNQAKRGSDQLLAAWKARTLTDASVKEIAEAIEQSPAQVESAVVTGGRDATGLRVTLSYAGDDGPWCGNDIRFWLQWHKLHGGRPRPPRVLINGIPFPDIVRLVLEFGDVEGPARGLDELPVAGFDGRHG